MQVNLQQSYTFIHAIYDGSRFLRRGQRQALLATQSFLFLIKIIF